MCCPAGGCALAHQRDARDSNEQHDAKQGEAVGVAHDRRLRADRTADGNDGLVPFSCYAGDPVRQGILL